MTAYQPNPGEIAGFDLFGRRQEDGTVKIGSNTYPDFPQECRCEGMTYTLELIKKNKDEGNLAPGHPGYDIEWGIYV